MPTSLLTINPDTVLHIRQGYRLQWEQVQNGWVLLFPEGMVQLNESAALILRNFQKGCHVSDAIAAIEQEFPDQATKQDILLFLEDAYAQRWLTS